MRVRTRSVFAIFAVLLTATWLFSMADREAVSSSLSHGSRGWSGTREYVRERGVEVEIASRPLGELEGEGALVLTFPWQLGSGRDERAQIQRWLRRGGTVLVAYSSEVTGRDELAVLGVLGLEVTELRSRPPVDPFDWWRYYKRRVSLEPPDGEGWDRRIELGGQRRAPRSPSGAEILLVESDERAPLVFRFPLAGGEVFVLPAALLANSNLARPDTVDVLESLIAAMPSRWVIDERHHGLEPPEGAAAGASLASWDLFLGHLLLVYVLGMAALARPFGPAWPDISRESPRTLTFLRGIGALHRRLGHHRRAAELLRERMTRLSSLALGSQPTLPEATMAVVDDRTLLAVAKSLEEGVPSPPSKEGRT